MLYRFFLFIIFCASSHISNSVREGLFLPEGDRVVRKALGKRKSNIQHLLPSKRDSNQHSVAFFRFYGNFGEKENADPRWPRHHQAALENDEFSHPIDPVSAFLQTLYPSPSGVLRPNQAALDPIGALSMGQVGRIVASLQLLQRDFSDSAQDTFVKELHHTLSIRDKLLVKMPEFLQWEQKPNEKKPGKLQRDTKGCRRIRFFMILLEAAEFMKKKPYQEIIYPPNILEVSLVTYAWSKARSMEDMNSFYKVVTKDDSFALPSRMFGKEDYDAAARSLDLSMKVVPKIRCMAPGKASMALHGGRFFDFNQFFSQPYMSVRYRGKSYPNCVEMSVYNFVVNIIRDSSTEGGIFFQKEFFSPESSAYAFFAKHRTLDRVTSFPAIQEWSDTCMVDQPGISYVRRYLGSKEKTYEMFPGFKNIASILASITGENTLHCKEGKEVEAVINSFQQICSYFSREGHMLSVDPSTSLSFNTLLKDYVGTVAINRNGSPFCTWIASNKHSSINGTGASDSFGWKSRFNQEVMPEKWNFGLWRQGKGMPIRGMPAQNPEEDYTAYFAEMNSSLISKMAYSLPRRDYWWVLGMLPHNPEFATLVSLAQISSSAIVEEEIEILIRALLLPTLGSRYEPVILSLARKVNALEDVEILEKLACSIPYILRYSQKGERYLFLRDFVRRVPDILLVRTNLAHSSFSEEVPVESLNQGEPLAFYFERQEDTEIFSLLAQAKIKELEIYSQEFYQLLKSQGVFSLMAGREIKITIGPGVSIDKSLIENLGKSTAICFEGAASITGALLDQLVHTNIESVTVDFSPDFSSDMEDHEKMSAFEKYTDSIAMLLSKGFVQDHEFYIADVEGMWYDDVYNFFCLLVQKNIHPECIDLTDIKVINHGPEILDVIQQKATAYVREQEKAEGPKLERNPLDAVH